jgi:acyl carrier protein
MEVDVMRRVQEIVADVTLQPASSVTSDAGAGRLEGWDSLAQINIVVSVEAAFDITFGAEEVHTLDSVAKIVAALNKAGVAIR